MSRVSLMVSGGLDSYVAQHFALASGFQVEPIYVMLGHPYQKTEIAAVTEMYRQVTLVRSNYYLMAKEFSSDHIIWGRNAHLSLIGGLHNPVVWLMALDGEQNGAEGDKSKGFFVGMSHVLTASLTSLHGCPVVVESPFAEMSKAEVIAWALGNGVDREALFRTTSCYSETHDKCGVCLTCFKRAAAFLLNDIEEPGYATNPFKSEYAKALSQRMRSPTRVMQFGYQRVLEFQQLQDMGVL